MFVCLRSTSALFVFFCQLNNVVYWGVERGEGVESDEQVGDDGSEHEDTRCDQHTA